MKAAGDGLVVYLEFLRDLCGGPEAGLLSEALTGERSVENLRKWYDSLGGDGCSEVQTLALLHRSSNMSDVDALELFDLLDWDASGALSFPALFFLVALLAACHERQLRLFLYHRAPDAAHALLVPADSLGGKTESFSLSRVLALSRAVLPPALEASVLAHVRRLQSEHLGGARHDISRPQLEALLFAVAESYDMGHELSSARLSAALATESEDAASQRLELWRSAGGSVPHGGGSRRELGEVDSPSSMAIEVTLGDQGQQASRTSVCTVS